MTDEPGGGDRGRTLPYVLIGIGLLLLLTNLGWFGDIFGSLFSLLRLWPVALIAVGADMVTRGRYRLIVIAAAVVVGLLVLASWQRPGSRLATGETQIVDIALDGADSIDLEVDSGVAELRLDSATSGAALSGEITPVRAEIVDIESSVSGGTLEILVRSRSERGPFGWLDFVGGPGNAGGSWDLTMREGVPVDLEVDSGVGSVELDLGSIDLRRLELDAGVGSTRVELPATEFDASINGGVGSVRLLVPRDAAVRIDVDTGLGDVDIDGSFERDGDSYTTAAYRDQGGGARIAIDVGIGEVTVDTVP